MATLCTKSKLAVIGALMFIGLLLLSSEHLHLLGPHSSSLLQESSYRSRQKSSQSEMELGVSHRSKAFDIELAAYEKRHAFAAARFESDLASGTTSRDDTRYFIFHVEQSRIGLGNTKMVIVSAFLYAMLTNRTFFAFEGRFDASQVYRSPVYWPRYFKPHDGPALETLSQWSKHASLLQTGTDSRYLSCMGDNAQLIWLKSDLYLIPNIYQVPEFTKKLDKLFPDRNVFAVLDAYLFQISPSLNPLIQPFIDQFDAARAKGQRVVGLHIRTFKSGDRITTIENTMSCIQQRNWSFPHTLFFLATLDPAIKETLEKAGAMVIAQVAESKQAYDLRHIQLAAADIHLLSVTDDLVLSGGSTMSYSAGGRRGRLVSYISNTGCFFEDWEPCMHMSPSPNSTCNNSNSFLEKEVTIPCRDTVMLRDASRATAVKIRLDLATLARAL